MAERSKGFRIGAIGLFVCAIGLLTYVWATNGDDGPAAVPPDTVAEQPAPEAPQEPVVVNTQVTEEATSAEVPIESNEQAITPEQVKKARSFMD